MFKEKSSGSHRKRRHPILFVVLVQLCALAAVSLPVLLLSDGTQKSYSLIIGGLVFCVSNVYFWFYARKHRDHWDAEQAYRSMFKGEIGKLLLAITLFALAYRFISFLDPVFLMMGFIVMITINWFVATRIVNIDTAQQTQKTEF